jgi:hypothetical protein
MMSRGRYPQLGLRWSKYNLDYANRGCANDIHMQHPMDVRHFGRSALEMSIAT